MDSAGAGPKAGWMLLTKFTQSCIRLEKDGKVLVFDPGNFSETDRALAGADTVLVTHEHADHIDVDAVATALSAGTSLQLYAPAGVAAQLRDKAPGAGPRIHAVGHDERIPRVVDVGVHEIADIGHHRNLGMDHRMLPPEAPE